MLTTVAEKYLLPVHLDGVLNRLAEVLDLVVDGLE